MAFDAMPEAGKYEIRELDDGEIDHVNGGVGAAVVAIVVVAAVVITVAYVGYKHGKQDGYENNKD